jgi:hypothetical protein
VLVSRVNGASEFTNIDALVYPNPAQNVLNVDFQNIEIGAKLAIVNTLGAVVWEGLVHSDKNTLNTGELSNGMYFLQVFSEKGTLMKKFVKQ